MVRCEFVKGNYRSKKCIYNVLHYILDWQKNPHNITNAESSSDEGIREIAKDFKTIQQYARKTSGKRILHLYVSPDPDMCLTASDFEKIAEAIVDIFDDYQVIYALHEFDNSGTACHIHLHFGINPISYRTGKRFRLIPNELKMLHKKINAIVDEVHQSTDQTDQP